MDTRMGFPCPFWSVVIDSINPCGLTVSHWLEPLSKTWATVQLKVLMTSQQFKNDWQVGENIGLMYLRSCFLVHIFQMVKYLALFPRYWNLLINRTIISIHVFHKFIHTRYYGGVGLACLILLVVVLQFFGLAFGVCGHKAEQSPTQRGCMGTAGGNMLMA